MICSGSFNQGYSEQFEDFPIAETLALIICSNRERFLVMDIPFDDPEAEDAFARFDYTQNQMRRRWFPPGFWWILAFLISILTAGIVGGMLLKVDRQRSCPCERTK